MPELSQWVQAVRRSHDRFAALVSPLSPAQVEGPSYDAGWSVADVASHLGSQAEIFELFLSAGLSGGPVPGGSEFAAIWDTWNALPPTEQVARSVQADERFVTSVEQLPAEDAARFEVELFGGVRDLSGLLGMRLSEHSLHTWDVEVALDPDALLAPDAVALLVDQVAALAPSRGSVARPGADLVIETVEPTRRWQLSTHPDVVLGPAPDPLVDPPLRLSAESFIRLLSGRLDPDYTPVQDDDPRLGDLRAVFTGF